MRRIIVIVCGCCIVGLTATAAHSQQSGQRKPGFLGRILGLKTVPDARKVMDGNQQVQRHEQQQRTESRRLQIGPRTPFAARRRKARAQAFGSTTTAPMMQIRPASSDSVSTTAVPAVEEVAEDFSEPGMVRRIKSNNGRTVSSYTVPAGRAQSEPKAGSVIEAQQSQSLARVLRNRQSQPLNEVTRQARRMRNPFVPNRDDVYQPIASGPVPMPETLVVEEPPEVVAPVAPPLSVPSVPALADEPMPVKVVDTGSEKPEIGPVAKQEAIAVEPELPAVQTQPSEAPLTLPAVAQSEPQSVEPPAQASDELPASETKADEPPMIASTDASEFVLPRKVSADQSRWRRSTRMTVEAQPPVTNMHPVQRVDERPISSPGSATTRTVPAKQVSRSQPALPTPATVQPQPVRTAKPSPATIVDSKTAQPTPRASMPKKEVYRPSIQQVQRTPSRAASYQPQTKVVRTQQLPRITGRANTGGLPVIRPKGHTPAMPTVTPSATAQYETVRRAMRRTQARVQRQQPDRRPAMPRREPVRPGDDAPGRVLLFPQSAPTSQPTPAEPTAMATPGSEQKLKSAVASDELSRPKQQVIKPASRTVDAVDAVDAVDTTEVRPAIRTRTASVIGPAREQRSKYVDTRAVRKQAIADRPHLLGFKGFCPVELRDHRQLVDSGLEFYASYRNRTYYFSSADAKKQFEQNPKRYVPVADGRDIVLLTHTGTALQGKLDYAAWHDGRLFLFTSKKALLAFNSRPQMYANRF